MPMYIIERKVPGIHTLSAQQLAEISAKSNAVLDQLPREIQWIQSYVTEDKLYCVYRSPDEEMIRKHAITGGFPADRISRFDTIIGPQTADSLVAVS